MDTHFSETFKVFKEVIPFAVENQKTFKATCGKRFPTSRFSKSPTCAKCLQITQENFRLGEEARGILESFQSKGGTQMKMKFKIILKFWNRRYGAWYALVEESGWIFTLPYNLVA